MTKKIAVLVDSSSSLSQKEARELGLAFQALQIVHEGFETLKDGIDIASERLYELIEKGDSLTTSQSPLGENLHAVEELLNANDVVYCLPLSSGLSGAFNTWKAVEQEVPDKRLQVIDAKTIGTGMVELAEKIKKWAADGKSAEEIDRLVAQNAADTYGILICNDFDRLVKGGRLSAFKGAMATWLKLHVMVEFDDGKLTFKDKSRSVEKLIGGLKERMYTRLNIKDEGAIETIAFLHTFPQKEKQQQEEVFKSVQEQFGSNLKWKVAELPAVVACHTGLNAYAVLIKKKSE